MKKATHCTVCSCELTIDNKVKGYGRCHPCHLVKKNEEYYRNRDTYLNHQKQFYKNNKELCNTRSKVYREKNKEKLNAIGREKHKVNKEKNNASCRDYYQRNKDKVSAKNKRYNKNNRKKINEHQNAYLTKKYKNDSKFNLITRLRARTRSVLKSKQIKKTKGTLSYLGCSSEELQRHIESLFLEGMSWENKHLWHIDHIIPISLGNTEEEILKLNHYINLRPLWEADNIKKSNKIIEPQKEEENVAS